MEKLRAKGLKQKDIAEKIGVTQSCISHLQNGDKCSMETAIKLADAFETTLDDVIGRTPPDKTLTLAEKLLLELTAGDDDITRAAIRCAQGEKLIKGAEGEGCRVKAA